MTGGRVFQYHEARRTGGALSHGEQAVHALFAQVFLFQNRAGKSAFGGQRPGLVGQIGGAEQIGGRIGQRTGEGDGLGGAFAASRGGLSAVRHKVAFKTDGQPFGVLVFFRVRLFQGAEAIEAQQGGVDRLFHKAFPAAGQGRQHGLGNEDAFEARGPAAAQGRAERLAHGVDVDVFPRAEAHGQHAGDIKFGMSVQHGQFVPDAAGVAQGRGDGEPGRGGVHAGGDVGQAFALAEQDHHDVGLPPGRAVALKTYIHGVLLSERKCS